MRPLALLVTVAVSATLTGSVALASPGGVSPAEQKPVAGTSCRAFPADNYWRADISDLPRHARSRQWLARMSPDSDLHPDFGSSFGDGPDYGIPVTVVGPAHRRVKVKFQYAGESDRVRYPLGEGHPDRGWPQLGR